MYTYSAVKLGTNMLEMDCHLTKDKQVVVLHDACLLRTTGHDVLVKDLDYSQLPLIKTSINIDFDPGNKILLIRLYLLKCQMLVMFLFY